jgi:hypothetical protein
LVFQKLPADRLCAALITPRSCFKKSPHDGLRGARYALRVACRGVRRIGQRAERKGGGAGLKAHGSRYKWTAIGQLSSNLDRRLRGIILAKFLDLKSGKYPITLITPLLQHSDTPELSLHNLEFFQLKFKTRYICGQPVNLG